MKFFGNKDNDLKLIDDAFTRIDRNKDRFKNLNRIFDAKYPVNILKQAKEANRSAIYVPAIRDAILTLSAQFRAAFFSGKSPIEAISKDHALKHNLNQYIKAKLKKSKPSDELGKAFKGAMIFGFSSLLVRWDNVSQTPITTYLPISCLALDPSAINMRDAQYVCYRQKLNLLDIIKYYGDDAADKAGRDYSKKYSVKEIYKKTTTSEWIVTCFVESEKVADYTTSILPFAYGYAVSKIHDFDDENYKHVSELYYFGESVVDLTSAHQEEINKKRNQKIDQDELKMNPKVLIRRGSNFPTHILTSGAGTSGLVDDLNSYAFIANGGDINIERDLEYLKQELERAVGTTSIDYGVTNASDRRSASALQILSSVAGLRVEDMISTLNETLFESWANIWYETLRANCDIDEILKEGVVFADNIKINFGSTMAVAQRMSELQALFQLQAQGAQINPQIMKQAQLEYASLILGDEYDANQIFSEEPFNPQTLGAL